MMPRRYEDGVFCTPSGRAKFFARPWLEPEDSPGADFPLLLTTGRVAGQWHTRTKSGVVPALNKLDPEPYLQMNAADASELGINNGDRVVIRSRRGAAKTVARLSGEISPGTVFMPIHWNDLWEAGASTNEVTTDAADPISKQPALKYCAVSVRPVGYNEPIRLKVLTGAAVTTEL